jgi:photosystem II stability/assembly factor-like uncharacterized protein
MSTTRVAVKVLFTLGLITLVVGCATPQPPAASASTPKPMVAGSSSAPDAPTSLYTIAFADSNYGWIGGSTGLFSTVDRGRTWMEQNAAEPVVSLDTIDTSTAWALTATGSLLTTRNGGQRWASVSAPAQLKAASFVSANLGWVTDGANLYATEDGGASWADLVSPGPTAALSFADAQYGWVGGGGRLWHTADGGRTWELQLTLPESDRWVGPTWVHFSTRQDGWALFTLGQGCASQEPYELLHTVDGGQHWELRLTDQSACHPLPEGQRQTVPGGPGGYPVAFTVQQDTAWALVNSTAGGYLELVKIPGRGADPMSAGRLSLNAPASAAMGLAVTSPDDVWLVTGDARQALGRVLHSADGGSTWETRCDPRGTCHR